MVLAARLWPRSWSRQLRTDADRQALIRQAREAGRAAEEVITVSFGSTATHARPAPPTPAAGSADDVPFPVGEAAAAAHAAATVLAAQLEEFGHCRQQAETCPDPAERCKWLERRRAAADAVAATLSDLAHNDADLSAAVARHLC